MNPYISNSVRYHRTIFLSDFHIGSKAFDAEALLSFLKFNECETLYLVGDIVDGWKLVKRWHWNETINKIFDELARKVDHGTKLIYVPGNHDEEVRTLPILRKLKFSHRMRVSIRNRTVHRCADGRKFLVMHGDQFDRRIIAGRVSKISDRLYDLFLDLIGGHSHTKMIIDGEIKKFSLAKYLSKQGQKALHFLNNFERAIVREVKSEGVDGLICGHTHIPVLKHIGDITYGNCGCWLRLGHTALVESKTGELKLLDWPEHPQENETQICFSFMGSTSGAPNVLLSSDTSVYRPVTISLIKSIRKIWSIQATGQSRAALYGKQKKASNLLSYQATLQEIISKAVQGDIRVSHKISRNAFHILGVAPFIFKFPAKS